MGKPQRKASNSASKGRVVGSKKKPRFLIVCEDEASSLIYFQKMKQIERGLLIEPVAVHRDPSLKDIIKEIEDQTRSDNVKLDSQKDEALDYDGVFAVFDMDIFAKSRDTNGNKIEIYNSTVKRITELNKTRRPCRLVRSWPSFEYWVLLHIELYETPVICQGGDTSGHVMTKLVEKKFNDKYGIKYDKGKSFAENLYLKLKSDQEFALQNSEKRYQQALKSIGEVKSLSISREQCEAMNPFTEIHLLMDSIFNGKCIEPWGLSPKISSKKPVVHSACWVFSDFKRVPVTLEYLAKYLQRQYNP